MQDSQCTSWKDCYLKVIAETNQETLRYLVLATEDEMVDRLQEFGDSAGREKNALR